MRGHMACANFTRGLRRPPGTTHFPVLEKQQQQLCLRRFENTSGKLVRNRWPWGKANLMSETMCESLVTDGCGRMSEKRKAAAAAPQHRPPPRPAAVDATSSGSSSPRVSITPLEACDEGDKHRMLSTELRHALCDSTNPYPGSGVPALPCLLRIGCDHLLILVDFTLLRPMPTLVSTTSLIHSLDNLIPKLHCQFEDSAPQGRNRITFVCLCLEMIVLFGIFLGLGIKVGSAIGGVIGRAFAALLPLVFVPIQSQFRRTSVVRMQVGLRLMGRMDTQDLVQVKKVVDKFAGPGQQSMPIHVAAVAHQVLTDAVVALLTYSGCYEAADCELSTHSSVEDGEEKFTYYSLEERGMRFDETWENGSSTNRILPPESTTTSAGQRDYCQLSHLVVTLLVVAKGNWNLPPIKDAGDVVENLKKLGCIPAGAVEKIGVYCTPCPDHVNMALKYPKFKYI